MELLKLFAAGLFILSLGLFDNKRSAAALEPVAALLVLFLLKPKFS